MIDCKWGKILWLKMNTYVKYLQFYFFLVILQTGVSDPSLYDTLGVKRTATQKEIRQAYKNMAKQW